LLCFRDLADAKSIIFVLEGVQGTENDQYKSILELFLVVTSSSCDILPLFQIIRVLASYIAFAMHLDIHYV
jgi:hypothetical protein